MLSPGPSLPRPPQGWDLPPLGGCCAGHMDNGHSEAGKWDLHLWKGELWGQGGLWGWEFVLWCCPRAPSVPVRSAVIYLSYL